MKFYPLNSVTYFPVDWDILKENIITEISSGLALKLKYSFSVPGEDAGFSVIGLIYMPKFFGGYLYQGSMIFGCVAKIKKDLISGSQKLTEKVLVKSPKGEDLSFSIILNIGSSVKTSIDQGTHASNNIFYKSMSPYNTQNRSDTLYSFGTRPAIQGSYKEDSGVKYFLCSDAVIGVSKNTVSGENDSLNRGTVMFYGELGGRIFSATEINNNLARGFPCTFIDDPSAEGIKKLPYWSTACPEYLYDFPTKFGLL